jgi:hypothetical protein
MRTPKIPDPVAPAAAPIPAAAPELAKLETSEQGPAARRRARQAFKGAGITSGSGGVGGTGLNIPR